MTSILGQLPVFKDQRLLVGIDTSDDAAVYKLNETTAIIQTLDFFTPVVDDPYLFGQIAAANSLSDVYAMGGIPLTALNIVGFPSCLPLEILGEILKGGADKIKEAGALLVGGHTIQDNEPKYGLSVLGTVEPERVLTNAGARVGDVLILTKPLGIGILNTAIKADLVSNEVIEKVGQLMSYLNKYAAEGMIELGANGCTDITGFGLIGHSYEMASASNVTIEIDHKKVPIIEEALELASMGIIPGGAYQNMEYFQGKTKMDVKVPTEVRDVFFDPQTSGGLLISMEEDKALQLMDIYRKVLKCDFNIIGRVINKEEKAIIVI